jgi:hypothetical protein
MGTFSPDRPQLWVPLHRGTQVTQLDDSLRADVSHRQLPVNDNDGRRSFHA